MTTFSQHLAERGYTPNLRAWVDYESETVTFPLYHPGCLAGYQSYNWKQTKKRYNGGKYFTWISEAYKPLAFYLIYPNCRDSHSKQKLLVCEGIWDAVRCANAGYNTAAILTATPAPQFKWWFKHLYLGWETVAVLDNDENKAGQALAKLTDRAIMVEGKKDIGEYTQEEANEWLAKML
jgi:hypothetical protein